MQIALVGPWVLLAIGTVTVLGAGWLTISKPHEGRPFWMWVFGVLLLGVGVYGPTFLNDYSRVLQAILRMDESPGEESYAAFLDHLAKGEVPEELQGVGTAVMLREPIPGLEQMVARAAERTDEPAARAQLDWARETLEGDRIQAKVVTEQFLDGRLDEATLFKLAPTTRVQIADELERQPDRTRARALAPEELQRLRASEHLSTTGLRPR